MAYLSGAGCDGPARAAEVRADVERLIEQLADKDFHVREKAGKEIAALGTAALPVLQKNRAHIDPEVRRRLEELIPPLERAVTLMPKRASLHMTNKPLRDVLTELSRQTNYTILLAQEANRADKEKVVYTFHFDELPFWQALDRVCESTGLVLEQHYGEEGLRLSHQESYTPFVCYEGPFKVVATGFSYYRNNNFGQLPKKPVPMSQANHETLHLNLNVAAEPKLPLLRVGQIRLVSAEDDEKNSMLPRGNGSGAFRMEHRYYSWSGYRSYTQSTQAELIWPSKNARTLKELKGVIPITLLADQKPAVVTDKILSAKGKRFTLGPTISNTPNVPGDDPSGKRSTVSGTMFSIEDVSEIAGKQYQIRMTVTEEAKDQPQDYSRIQSLQQRLELQDGQGNKLPSYMNFIQFGGLTTAQFTLTTQPSDNKKLGPATKLVYYAWVLMEHEVPFEFKDLPLP
jgi:hypothetical protein